MGRAKNTNSNTRPNKQQRDTKSATAVGTNAGNSSALVIWPALKPKKDLALTELVTGHIFLVRGFLDKKECEGFIKIADAMCVPTPGVPKRGEAFRNNARWSITDEDCAQSLWENTGMTSLLRDWKHPDGKSPVGLFENIRLYRYGPGERFGKHYDDYFFDRKGRRSEYTLLVYLNAVDDKRFKTGDRPSGGETVFYARRMNPVSVKPEAGLALLHKHGADCLQHEALELRDGFKYVLRSDLIFG
ncbi:hypothetical protein COEREDRAFT_79281 [Coemansia reversa NRRL 1564]|uniref:Fe2OG dioxygenase domain-containing protein n=1 Tax=Coemansia reversa (strain ATCC 12441 / NRRL 1564) TaxID=763665 RepID=A0A2G5BK07_COERN|nr:hypothetical protein COEREDRAFT_79281 [Coemansia reversa NRRL 1564]|eukprot:PIA19346.1 hypothetical protein COEREDRAFT_79281 [Coemansia reversa NRRL 1564]